jgi:5-methylcytosine-specific restriction protein B
VVTFHPSYSYEDFVRGIRPVADDETGETSFRTVDGVFKQICDEARNNPSKRYALFIDEINRANIAKVFGELITLLEPDKRARFSTEGKLIDGMVVQLPGGSGTEVAEEPFGVPVNLDVYGTMNTADRSIALLDVALRRRFEFEEVVPKYELLSRSVRGVQVDRLLRRINDRLEYLLDRDHRIGHAYLIGAKTLDDLRRAFRMQIIPLLQEYFFDDFSRVALVLATPPGVPPFLMPGRISQRSLFWTSLDGSVPAERTRYSVTEPATWTEASFAGLYSDSGAAEPQSEVAIP